MGTVTGSDLCTRDRHRFRTSSLGKGAVPELRHDSTLRKWRCGVSGGSRAGAQVLVRGRCGAFEDCQHYHRQGASLSDAASDSACLEAPPRVVVGGQGVSGQAFVDNAKFREFAFDAFKAQVLDMETAAVATVAYANGVPFIGFRSLSDLARRRRRRKRDGDFLPPRFRERRRRARRLHQSASGGHALIVSVIHVPTAESAPPNAAEASTKTTPSVKAEERDAGRESNHGGRQSKVLGSGSGRAERSKASPPPPRRRARAGRTTAPRLAMTPTTAAVTAASAPAT